jgi:undecaprenyl-diphosphatase
MPRSTLFALAAFLLLIPLGLWGGPTQPLEVGAVRGMVAWRAVQPGLTDALALLTMFGNAIVLVPVALAAALALMRSSRLDAAFLLLTVLSGRLVVELLKWSTDRDRPFLAEGPVDVFNQSFPSGHAANSMLTLLALALYAAPPEWRRPALAIGVLLSLLIGMTRPLLGVHWPSDVLAGWLQGAAWTWLWWRVRLSRA